jgi:endonuclease-3
LATDPWELTVAAILSARTTDTQVNKVMATLGEHLVGIDAYARLEADALQALIRRLPLHGQKARAIVEAARAIIRHHHGRVPEDLAHLAALPGLGRKTAAVVAGNAFGVPAVAADVHVCRAVRRLGWIGEEQPRAAEAALRARFAPARWVRLCHQLIRLGRDHCRRQRPWCSTCPLAATCPRQGVDDAR